MKKVLVLCTGNSCRSIMAEALINKFLDEVEAKSAGSNPKGLVNPNAIEVLKEIDAWDDKYYSKKIDDVMNEDFDLVVTVCDKAKESCPMFPKAVKKIHVSFEDPDGKDIEEFRKTRDLIKDKLLKRIKEELF